MNSHSENMNDLLVRYLDGELEENEKEELEKQLETDKSLQEALQSLQAAREAIRYFGIKQEVANIHNQMMNELRAPIRKINPRRKILRYSLAAAASILLFFVGILAYKFFTLSPDKLFADNYKSYELNITRGAGTEPTAIESAYLEKRYNDVIRLSENSNDIESIFLSALSNIELKNISRGIDGFKKVIMMNEAAHTNTFKDEAEYYLALAYVQHKDYKLAYELMEKIQGDPSHLYNKKISAKLIRDVKWLNWR